MQQRTSNQTTLLKTQVTYIANKLTIHQLQTQFRKRTTNQTQLSTKTTLCQYHQINKIKVKFQTT